MSKRAIGKEEEAHLVTLREYWELLQRYLAAQRGAGLLMALALLGSIGLQLVGPSLVQGFIDAARAGATNAALAQAALLFIGVSVAQQLMGVLANYWSTRVAWTATNALRADLAAHLLGLDMAFHKTHTPGELIERVDGDVEALSALFSSAVVQLGGSALLLAGVVAAVWRIDWRFGLALAAFSAVALVALGALRGLAAPLLERSREQSAGFYGYIGEVIAAAEDLRASGAVPFALRGFFAHLQAWLPIERRASARGSAVWVGAIIIFGALDALTYGFGGTLYQRGALSLGTVYMLVAYAAMLADPIETIRTQFQQLQHADAGIARVRALLATRSQLVDGAQEIPGGALRVELEGVSFRYDDEGVEETRRHGTRDKETRDKETRDTRQGDSPPLFVSPSPPLPFSNSPQTYVLKTLNVRLEPGRILGVLGRTGSGKTTLARLLFRLYDPQAGAVLLGGVVAQRARIASLRSRVALVTQDVQLFEATLRDNITFFDASVPDTLLLDVLARLGLRAWLERLPSGLDTIISGASLSAGEAQLLALARVFIRDPGLVILDEASSRLDPATEALLEHAIDALLAGRTAVIIAHRLHTLDRADDILILEDGRVVEHGPRAALAADTGSRFAQLRRAGLEEMLA